MIACDWVNVPKSRNTMIWTPTLKRICGLDMDPLDMLYQKDVCLKDIRETKKEIPTSIMNEKLINLSELRGSRGKPTTDANWVHQPFHIGLCLFTTYEKWVQREE